ncbi:hypothetical protein [Nonomuraea sp. NPDC050310]|uniref:hypothetical protein n=1 Tax=Nonomuraea sp. NPDC050310 TaxID=3154935 RepID=UPI0033C0E1D9
MAPRIIYGDEDLRTALIAAIIKGGGELDVSFEALGEAALTAKIGEVRPAMERVANGVRCTIAASKAGGPDARS